MDIQNYSITRTFSIKIDLWERFKKKVHNQRLGISEVIVMLIERWLSEDN